MKNNCLITKDYKGRSLVLIISKLHNWMKNEVMFLKDEPSVPFIKWLAKAHKEAMSIRLLVNYTIAPSYKMKNIKI